jgi:hypothetical protein
MKQRESPWSPRGAMRNGTGDRPSNSRQPKKAETITTRSVLPRTGPMQSQQAGVTSATCDEVPCQESPHECEPFPPRDGISPVAVAGWAVARVIAEVGKWRKEKAVEDGAGGLPNQFEALEIFLGPASLVDHTLQGFACESGASAVKGHRDPSTVGMKIDLVRPVAAVIAEPVTDEG